MICSFIVGRGRYGMTKIQLPCWKHCRLQEGLSLTKTQVEKKRQSHNFSKYPEKGGSMPLKKAN